MQAVPFIEDELKFTEVTEELQEQRENAEFLFGWNLIL